jgi:hypothetical protein
MRWVGWTAVLGLVCGPPAIATPLDQMGIQRVMLVVLENADYDAAREQPFLAKLAREGGLLRQSFAVARPSQPNYLALAGGSTYGVDSDAPVTLDVRHIGDLLDAKGYTWKVYAEGYPGGCFLGSRAGAYVRRHIPFLSFKNVQSDPERCQRIVDAAALTADVRHGTLPTYAMYVPDVRHDGHDTGVSAADRWLSGAFGPLLDDPRFAANMLLIVTFDEGRGWQHGNHIYTVLHGERVIPGSVSDDRYDHYSLLRTIEEVLGLGTLGQGDSKASPITGIWKGRSS